MSPPVLPSVAFCGVGQVTQGTSPHRKAGFCFTPWGGNDVQLTNILNQCIFQWALLNQVQVAVAKAVAFKEGIDWPQDFGWDATGRGCEAQLELTQALIDSSSFSSSIDSVINAAKVKLAPDGVIHNTGVGLMFYELNSRDPLGSSPWKRSTEGPLDGTFEGSLDQFAQITLLMDPNAAFTNEDKIDSAEKAVKIQSQMQSNLTVPELDIEVPNLLPDGYGRVFPPQILGHQIISNLVIYDMVNHNEMAHGLSSVPEMLEINSCPYFPGDPDVLSYTGVDPGGAVKPGTELRIPCVGDSITVGFLSGQDGGDGNGYRLQLRNDLSTWSGKTIQYISDHVDESLAQRPNIILIAAGTNDMNPNSAISTEGNDPAGAADRLGKLVDKALDAWPDAVVLIAMIIDTCDPQQSPRIQEFEALVSGVAKQRRDAGRHVLAVDFTTFSTSMLRDCISRISSIPLIDGRDRQISDDKYLAVE
ncbi:hypothetical protein N0V82_007187 [Gnomoniopsis sp. IMI 355080]|nr:hypothetical protein N0V82_007187 [Gnomoniopsis sp. IMI 355080]